LLIKVKIFTTILAASIVLFSALGCGQIIIPLRVFKLSKHLKIAVELGLVLENNV
jgi:hypothetical protein